MATITPATPDPDGTTPVSYVSATAAGDTLATGHSSVGLLVRNDGAADVTVTLGGVRLCSQDELHDEPYPVPAGKHMVLPVPLHCMDEGSGDVAVAYDSAAGVTVGAMLLPAMPLSPITVRAGLVVFDNGDGTLTLYAVRPGAMTDNGDGTLTLATSPRVVAHDDGTLTLATV